MDIKYEIVATKEGKGSWVTCARAESQPRQMNSLTTETESSGAPCNYNDAQDDFAISPNDADSCDSAGDGGHVQDDVDQETVEADNSLNVTICTVVDSVVKERVASIPTPSCKTDIISMTADGDNGATAIGGLCDHKVEVISPSNDFSSISLAALASTVNLEIETNVISDVLSSSDGVSTTATNLVSSDIADPAQFSNVRITASVINLLLSESHIPSETVTLPIRNGRTCSRSWFFVVMPDGEKRLRKWLGYSTSTDRLFCIDCMLFTGPSCSDTWTRRGYSDWTHATRDIPAHESSSEHHASEMARFMWNRKNRIDDHMLQLEKSTSDRNRRVVYVSIKCLKYLSSEMVAIRGHGAHDGKFLHLFREFAEFEASAASYLEMLDGIRSRESRTKPEVNLLSPLNCRRLLITMRNMVVKKIVADIKNTKVCSLISDGTQDESKMEAQGVLLRYLETTSSGLRPVERLVDIFTTGDTSGLVLSERIETILKSLHVPLEWLVGQSYDGAGNVRGKYTGLKTRILEIAPRAMYIWCNAHRLNLVVEAVLKCSSDICNALGTVQELYNFFTGHKRHSILVEMQRGESANIKALKRVSDTTRSWRSAEDGIATLLDCYDSIVSALKTLAVKSKDPSTTASANGLLVQIEDSRLIMTTIFLQHIFHITGPVSRLLQSKAADLSIAANLIDNCIQQLEKKRENADKFFVKIRREATEFCESHGIKPQLKDRRRRKKKRMADEQCDDDSIPYIESAFKVDVVICGLDVTLQQLRDRFTDQNVAFLREIHHFSPAGLLSVKSVSPKDVENICNFYNLDANIIARERNSFAPEYRSMAALITVSDLSLSNARDRDSKKVNNETEEQETISHSETGDDTESGVDSRVDWLQHSFIKPLRALDELSSFPNLLCLMKILATVAVTSCSAERVMSRVKIIKNRLRSTMDDDWFSALTILASERDIMDSLSTNDIIDSFALCSPKLQSILGVHIDNDKD
jgi:hypothetical protein